MRRLWHLALILAFALASGTGPARAETVIERLVSPGPLSRGHAKLETRCNACHLSFKRAAQPAQCLTCHKGIARDRTSRTRFHGLMLKARTAACRECHTEHKGLRHRLARLDLKAFNHQTQSAYRLTGGHVRTKCAACHKGMTRFREAPQACASCHQRQDVHKGRLGQQCQSCHTTNRWRELLPFDHDRTRYPLIGAHRTTPCIGCHVKEQWHGAPTACVSCHLQKDVHRGASGPRCADCHLTTNWRAIAFNHERVAAFPLRGAHRTVTCIGCHARTARPVAAPVACVGCHLKDDVHRGADGPKCA
uniref:cytochrome c3 family protein n=1 Tax=Novosphingobium sp. TaxID=1874826 RepID=UPI002631E3D2